MLQFSKRFPDVIISSFFSFFYADDKQIWTSIKLTISDTIKGIHKILQYKKNYIKSKNPKQI